MDALSGWVPQDASWWPVIAEALPKPWPAEAVYNDLRWWQDQERLGLTTRPGRPALVRRWGVTDYRAREYLNDEAAWGTPIEAHRKPTAFRQPIASVSPADRQPASAPTPATVEKSPEDRQPIASVSPADRPTCEKIDSEEQRPETRFRDRTARARGHSTEEQELLGTCRTLLQDYDPTQFELPEGQRPSIFAAAVRGVTAEQATLVFTFFQKSSAGMAKIAKEGRWNQRWKPILNPDNFTAYLAEATAWDKRGRTDEIPVAKQHPNTGRWDDLAGITPARSGKPFIDVEFTTENGHGFDKGSSELLQAPARRRPAG